MKDDGAIVELADLITDPLCLLEPTEFRVLKFNGEFGRVVSPEATGQAIHKLLPVNADILRKRIGRGRQMTVRWTSPDRLDYLLKFKPHALGVVVHGTRVIDPRHIECGCPGGFRCPCCQTAICLQLLCVGLICPAQVRGLGFVWRAGWMGETWKTARS